MKNNQRILKAALNAGKSPFETSTAQLIACFIAVVVDSVLFFTSLEGAITERFILNIIVSAAGVMAVDVTPVLLSKLIYMGAEGIHPKTKRFVGGVLIAVLIVAFLGMGAVRWATRSSLSGGHLGLVNVESTSNSALDTVAVVLAILPIVTSLVVFFLGILNNDPRRRYKKLIEIENKLAAMERELEAQISEIEPEETRRQRMIDFVNDVYESQNTSLLSTLSVLNDEFNILLCGVIQAGSSEISNIMEV